MGNELMCGGRPQATIAAVSRIRSPGLGTHVRFLCWEQKPVCIGSWGPNSSAWIRAPWSLTVLEGQSQEEGQGTWLELKGDTREYQMLVFLFFSPLPHYASSSFQGWAAAGLDLLGRNSLPLTSSCRCHSTSVSLRAYEAS